MKKLQFGIIVSIIISLVGCNTEQPKKEGTIIHQLMEEQANAWNRGDLETFMQPYWKSDSVVFIGSGGPVYGWQQTLDNYKKSYPGRAAMGKLSFTDVKVDVLSENSAFVTGGWHLKRENDEPSGYFTLLFKKIDGEWKIVADHSS